MLFLAICITALMYASADNIPEESLQKFRKEFFEILSKHASNQYEMLEDTIESVETIMAQCRKDLTQEIDQCKSSLTVEACSQGTIDKIETYLGNINAVLDPVLSFFSTPEWEELEKYLDGLDVESRLFSREWNDLDQFQIPETQARRTHLAQQDDTRTAFDKSSLRNILDLLSRKRRNLGLGDVQLLAQRMAQQMYAQLDYDANNCLKQFDVCSNFLYIAPIILQTVCGPDNVKEILGLTAVFANLQAMHQANGDPETAPILKKVEYNPNSGNPEIFSYSEVYITAITPNGEEKYKSKYEYNAEFPEVSAKIMAIELIGKWGFKNVSNALAQKHFKEQNIE